MKGTDQEEKRIPARAESAAKLLAELKAGIQSGEKGWFSSEEVLQYIQDHSVRKMKP